MSAISMADAMFGLGRMEESSLLRAANALVDSADIASLAAAADAFISSLIPGAILEHKAGPASEQSPGSASMHSLQIPLYDDHGVLVLSAPRSVRDRRLMLAAQH